MMCTDFATYELTLTPLSRGNIAKLTRTLIVPPCLHRFRNTAIDNTPRVSDMQPAMHCAGHLWAGENRYFIIGGKRQRGIRHSPPSISVQYEGCFRRRRESGVVTVHGSPPARGRQDTALR